MFELVSAETLYLFSKFCLMASLSLGGAMINIAETADINTAEFTSTAKTRVERKDFIIMP